jgi:hypothetical protein
MDDIIKIIGTIQDILTKHKCRLEDVQLWNILWKENKVHINFSFRNGDYANYSLKHLGDKDYSWTYTTKAVAEAMDRDSY